MLTITIALLGILSATPIEISTDTTVVSAVPSPQQPGMAYLVTTAAGLAGKTYHVASGVGFYIDIEHYGFSAVLNEDGSRTFTFQANQEPNE